MFTVADSNKKPLNSNNTLNKALVAKSFHQASTETQKKGLMQKKKLRPKKALATAHLKRAEICERIMFSLP